MLIVSRIIHVKVNRRLNVTNKFIYQRRLSSRLAIVMFRGTPCRLVSSRFDERPLKRYDDTENNAKNCRLLYFESFLRKCRGMRSLSVVLEFSF